MKGRHIKVRVDTCSVVNVIDELTFENFEALVQLKKTKLNLFAYGQTTPLRVLGKFTEAIDSRKGVCLTDFLVVKGNDGCLITADTTSRLKLIKCIHKIDTHMVPVPSVEEPGDKKYVEGTLSEFPNICKGIGKLRDVQVHLHIDPSVKPVIQPSRRVPFALRAKVEEELERLEKSGVVEKVEEPTTWVSPIVIQQKIPEIYGIA